MNMTFVMKSAVILPVVFLLFACGSSSEPTPMQVPENNPEGGIEGGGLQGIEGGGIVSAISTDFSKITVSSVVYDASAPNLTVEVDDQPAGVSDLRVGNAIRFTATTSSTGGDPELKSIVTLAELEGPITAGSIDLTQGIFFVLGQRVEVTASTEFDDDLLLGGLQELTDGSLVEVSGISIAPGVIRASRIERGDSSDEFELFGEVLDLNNTNFTFRIGMLVIDYSSAELEDFAPGDTLQNGDYVEVEGLMLNGNGVLIATEVENQIAEFSSGEGSTGSVEGAITRFMSAVDFDVAGFPVTTNGQTEFERGGVDDLSVGVVIKVEGSVNGDSVLVADKIEFTADEASSSAAQEDWM